jgi:D-glycero-alpha-D-manno-heptose-7-phosphate kinase
MVALVGLLKEFHRIPMTDYEIAHRAYELERVRLGIQGGLQDQYAAAFGGFNFIEFASNEVIVNPLRISEDVMNELQHNLLLCYTGSTRLSDHIIDDQTERYERSEEAVVSALRRQKELAVSMKSALLRRRLSEFGCLLHEAWMAKRRLSPKIATPVIDEIYEAARHHGALGGKVTGAGGGGHMLLYAPFERKHRIAEVVRKAGGTLIPFAFEPRGLQNWRVPDDELGC